MVKGLVPTIMVARVLLLSSRTDTAKEEGSAQRVSKLVFAGRMSTVNHNSPTNSMNTFEDDQV